MNSSLQFCSQHFHESREGRLREAVKRRPGESIESDGVTIAGPLNLASMGAQHASEMYARNVYNFVSLLLKDGALVFDWSDELLAKTVWPERVAAA